MNATRPSRFSSDGFTLIEVLIALALCVLLAVSVSSAVSFSTFAEIRAATHAEASFLIQNLYASQRLDPNADLPLPPAWSANRTTEKTKCPEPPCMEWELIAVAPKAHTLAPIFLRILQDAP